MTVGQVIAKLGVDPKEYEKGLKKAEGQAKKAGSKIGGIFKQAFSFGLGMGLVSGFKSLGGAITDFVNTAARTEVLNVAMQSVAKASGYAITALREQRDAVMDLGIAEQEATQILTRFMQAQLDTADAAKLARVAQDAAVIAGYNSSQAAEQMTEAIAKQRPELLSAFGMTRNMNEIYSDYAMTIGKTATQLVEAEKKQAMLNYILKEGEKIAGTYEASMGVVGKQISSLPRYWDTLKNAIAKPLALPALSVFVEAITNGLKNAINWAEANKYALQTWGQTAANVAGFIVRAFQTVSRVFMENWTMIKIAGVSLLTYATASKIAAGATAAFRAISLALKGELASQIPILSWVSTAVGIYKVQMALASMQGIVMTGVLAKLKVALYSLWAALGPIGWIILAITAIVAGGMALWNKYAQSVQKAWETSMAEKMKAQQEKLRDSMKGVTGATEDQTDALADAAKAASKNLQSFDEVHQLQEDMSDTAAGDMFAMPDAGLFDTDAFDMEGMLDFDFEGPKTSLAGFWDWIKEGAGNLWEGVKEKWNGFKEWVKSWAVWEWLGEKWEGLKEWTGNLWEGVKEKWTGFKEWVGSWAGPLWEDIKEKWDGFKEWAGNMWEGTKEKWGNFTDWVQEKWDNFKTKAGEIWEGIKTTVQSKWEDLKTNAPIIWENIKTSIQTRWENLKTSAGETWDNITTGIEEKWNLLKTNAPIAWENIKTSIQDRWEALKTDAPVLWENIRKNISEKWENLKTNAPTTWEKIKTEISTRWDALKTDAPLTWESIRKTITEKWGELKTNVGPTWNSIKTTIAEKWEEIKEDAFNWGKNLISSFVEGIENKIKSVKSTLKNVGNTIKDFLGFSSPTKEGPGRFADEWAPNLMNMFAEGISSNIPKVRSAVDDVTRQISGIATPSVVQQPTYDTSITADNSGFADEIAQAVYRAIMDAIRFSRASSSQSSDDRELVLKIDNTVLARMQLPAIIREGQRQGLNLVVQPQGV